MIPLFFSKVVVEVFMCRVFFFCGHSLSSLASPYHRVKKLPAVCSGVAKCLAIETVCSSLSSVHFHLHNERAHTYLWVFIVHNANKILEGFLDGACLARASLSNTDHFVT
jgi:hypothetical protein